MYVVRCIVAVLAFQFSCLETWLPQNSSKPDSLQFVRQFSSAQDVKREHPVIDKTLEIVAGPKEEVATTDVLQSPIAVAATSKQRVYVVDVGSSSVHVFDFERGKYLLIHDAERMKAPTGIAVDSEENLYVTDRDSANVLVFDPKGKFSHRLMRGRGRESYFEAPRGIAIHNASGRLYVCDTGRKMVIVLDKHGKVLGRIGKRGGGSGPGEFNKPMQVAVGRDSLFVLDSGNRRIQEFDLQGRFQRQISFSDLDNRSGLAVDDSGRLYVSDVGLSMIHVLNPQGEQLYNFGSMGNEQSRFNGPTGLSIKGSRLYVVDTNNRRIQEFRIGSALGQAH